jgi:hypothetical protein
MASIVLAVASTVADALGGVQQRRAAMAEPRLERRRAWWLAIGLPCVGPVTTSRTYSDAGPAG